MQLNLSLYSSVSFVASVVFVILIVEIGAGKHGRAAHATAKCGIHIHLCSSVSICGDTSPHSRLHGFFGGPRNRQRQASMPRQHVDEAVDLFHRVIEMRRHAQPALPHRDLDVVLLSQGDDDLLVVVQG
jgi:hypothetical protein